MNVTDCFAGFQESQGLQDCPGFHLKNQGTMLILLYGLLVVPREMWWQQPNLPEFAFETRRHFQFDNGNPDMSATDFLRFLRNAIAHANFDIVDLDAGIYEFWNMPPNGRINFAVRISHNESGQFITEVGRYYINCVLPRVQQNVDQ
jgi:hypothetical protein